MILQLLCMGRRVRLGRHLRQLRGLRDRLDRDIRTAERRRMLGHLDDFDGR